MMDIEEDFGSIKATTYEQEIEDRLSALDNVPSKTEVDKSIKGMWFELLPANALEFHAARIVLRFLPLLTTGNYFAMQEQLEQQGIKPDLLIPDDHKHNFLLCCFTAIQPWIDSSSKEKYARKIITDENQLLADIKKFKHGSTALALLVCHHALKLMKSDLWQKQWHFKEILTAHKVLLPAYDSNIAQDYLKELDRDKDLNVDSSTGKFPEKALFEEPSSSLNDVLAHHAETLINFDLIEYRKFYMHAVSHGGPHVSFLHDVLDELIQQISSYQSQGNANATTQDLSASVLSERASAEDHLGRTQLVKSMADLFDNTKVDESLTIGLLGDWGAGKTSVLKQLADQLSSLRRFEYTTHEFNAWSYEHTADIQAGVAQEAVAGLTKDQSFWQKTKTAWRLNEDEHGAASMWARVLLVGFWILAAMLIAYIGRGAGVLRFVSVIGVGAILSAMTFYKLVKPLFATTFALELSTYLNLPDYSDATGQLPVYQKHIQALARICLKDNQRLIFFVDDLDRCSADGIVKVFESIRLVMDLERVHVIIAIDHRIALAALAKQYSFMINAENRKTSAPHQIAREYLAKIIHIPILLSLPSKEDIATYVHHIFGPLITMEAESENSTDPNEAFLNETDPDALTDTDQQDPGAVISDAEDIIGTEDHSGQLVTQNQQQQNNKPEKPIVAEAIPVIQHTETERRLFLQLCEIFSIGNPRQIKRFKNAYQLVCSYYGSDSTRNHSLMIALFVQEYLIWGDDSANELENSWQNLLTDHTEEPLISEFLADKEHMLTTIRRVVPFTFPASSAVS